MEAGVLGHLGVHVQNLVVVVVIKQELEHATTRLHCTEVHIVLAFHLKQTTVETQTVQFMETGVSGQLGVNVQNPVVAVVIKQGGENVMTLVLSTEDLNVSVIRLRFRIAGILYVI